MFIVFFHYLKIKPAFGERKSSKMNTFVTKFETKLTMGFSSLNHKILLDCVSSTGDVFITVNKTSYIIQGYKYLNASLKVSTHKLFDFLMIALTKKSDLMRDVDFNGIEIIVSLTEFMDCCGLAITAANKNKTRKWIKSDLEIFKKLSVNTSEKRRTKTANKVKEYNIFCLFDNGWVKGDRVSVTFNYDFIVYLRELRMFMNYPLTLFKTDGKMNSYYLGKKLAYHYGLYNNWEKERNLISVTRLMAYAPNLPTYKKVMDTGRQVTKRILEPLKRDLDSLSPILNWEFVNARKEPLTELQAAILEYQTEPVNIDVLMNCFVKVDINDFPNLSLVIEERKKRIDAMKSRSSKPKKTNPSD